MSGDFVNNEKSLELKLNEKTEMIKFRKQSRNRRVQIGGNMFEDVKNILYITPTVLSFE